MIPLSLKSSLSILNFIVFCLFVYLKKEQIKWIRKAEVCVGYQMHVRKGKGQFYMENC